MEDFACFRWAPTVFTAFYHHHSTIGRHLFPSLREVRWVRPTASSDIHPEVPCFLSQALTSLEIEISTADQHSTKRIQTLFPAFPVLLPEVESISIKGGSPRAVLDVRSLPGCAHLRSFISTIPISLESAVQLSSLPKLETLSFTMLDQETSSAPLPTPCGFRSLRSLSYGPSPTFIQACHFPVLQDFTAFRPQQLSPLLEALVKHCNPKLLRTVRTDCPLGSATPEVFIDHIRPLLKLHDLESVAISNSGCSQDDKMIETMSLAWPNLKVLSLTNPSQIYCETHPTWRGLLHLVRNCPALCSLSIEIETRELKIVNKEWNSVLGTNMFNPHVEAIDFQCSLISNYYMECKEISAFLLRLFPNLKTIHRKCYSTSDEKSWEMVERLLRNPQYYDQEEGIDSIYGLDTWLDF